MAATCKCLVENRVTSTVSIDGVKLGRFSIPRSYSVARRYCSRVLMSNSEPQRFTSRSRRHTSSKTSTDICLPRKSCKIVRAIISREMTRVSLVYRRDFAAALDAASELLAVPSSYEFNHSFCQVPCRAEISIWLVPARCNILHFA
jgi:hypothetical protein